MFLKCSFVLLGSAAVVMLIGAAPQTWQTCHAVSEGRHTMQSNETPRSIERTIELNAPVEVVWKALTDAEQLANWFPREARVKPGAGGSIWMHFMEGMAWETPIGIWEPNKRLQLVYCEPNDQVPFRVTVDYFLEGKGGTTSLRLVHNGFSADAAWDGLYEGTVRGWEVTFVQLKHYLERHRDVERTALMLKRNIGNLPVKDAWARLMSAKGILSAGEIKGEGQSFSIKTSTGIALNGTAMRFRPPEDICARLPELNDALIRIQIDDIFGSKDVYITMSLWGVGAARAAELEQKWQTLLDSLFADVGAPARMK